MIIKKHYFSFLSLFLFSINNAFAQYAWTQKADFGGGPRYGAAGFSIGTQIYLGLGITHVGSNDTYYNDFWEWDQSTNTWTQMADFPGLPRNSGAGFSIGDTGYITLGWSPAALNDLWEYDPSSNAWKQKTDFGGSARYDAAWFVIGNYVYVGTGYAPYSSDFWQYNPATDSWTQIADIGGGARSAAVGFAVDTFGYVACGGQEDVFYSTDLWRYDPSSNSWSQMSSFPGQGRVAPSAFAFAGKFGGLGFVGNGCTDDSVFSDYYSYDPSSDSWSQIANFPGQGVIWSKGFSIGGYGYVGTGSDGIYPGGTDRVDYWQYGPTSVPPPTASFQSSDSILCTNDCISFTDQSSNATSWKWLFPGATPDSSSDENPQTICYFISGNYNVTHIVSNAIGSDTLALTDYIKVNPTPPTPVIIESHDTLTCSFDPSYSEYQWYYYNTPIIGAIDTFLVAYYSGNYNLKVTNKNGCAISVGINVILGINELEENDYFNIYPNPVSDELAVSINKNFHNADIEIFDLFGRKLFQRDFDSTKGNNLTLDFRSFVQGTYYISVTVDGERISKKFLKISID